MTSIYQNYKELKELWDWCLDEYKVREAKEWIHGVQSQMQTFEHLFRLGLTILLHRHCDNLSTSLQAKDLRATEAQIISKKIVETL